MIAEQRRDFYTRLVTPQAQQVPPFKMIYLDSDCAKDTIRSVATVFLREATSISELFWLVILGIDDSRDEPLSVRVRNHHTL